jgi:hypothetical protein
MGYTHYWKFKDVPRGNAKNAEESYQLAIRQCQRVIKTYNAEMKKIDDKHPERLSGYSAHTKVDEYGGLKFNGVGELAHEDFTAREHYSENEGFNFCKTAQKPYDTVVTACLIVLEYYMGGLIEVSSDGDSTDWESGLELAKRVLKIKFENPIPERD